jgi:hypothetical protein
MPGAWMPSGYQWLDRAPKERNESGQWFRRHDKYASKSNVDASPARRHSRANEGFERQPHPCPSRAANESILWRGLASARGRRKASPVAGYA